MTENPVTCGNCHTENAPGSDYCSNCSQPLTRSAEEGMIENEQAQNRGGIFTPTSDTPGGAENTYVPNTDTPVNDGLPTD